MDRSWLTQRVRRYVVISNIDVSPQVQLLSLQPPKIRQSPKSLVDLSCMSITIKIPDNCELVSTIKISFFRGNHFYRTFQWFVGVSFHSTIYIRLEKLSRMTKIFSSDGLKFEHQTIKSFMRQFFEMNGLP